MSYNSLRVRTFYLLLMSSAETDIDDIIKEIKTLKITNQRTVKRIEEPELRTLKLQSVRTATQETIQSRHWTGHMDKYKRKIFIGDKVKFLTSGKFSSTEGVVSGYTKSRVTATDKKNNEIPRAPHNLLLILSS